MFCVMLQAVAGRLECVKKESELMDLRMTADEAVKQAETANTERSQMKTCFDQEIHDVTKTYEGKVYCTSKSLWSGRRTRYCIDLGPLRGS